MTTVQERISPKFLKMKGITESVPFTTQPTNQPSSSSSTSTVIEQLRHHYPCTHSGQVRQGGRGTSYGLTIGRRGEEAPSSLAQVSSALK
ncbi:hypothetical protein Pmani_009896 [Petrolisthes manimaculis]|uniref:Uncharacterized protein n=1 Tax=Petrolisthes manimaculis TaxID=1843537 RepID=A0AAE1Q3T6_9EUCA|nr:hypothetical protein Pmani_009896 [Petrolisthes manimaculis]